MYFYLYEGNIYWGRHQRVPGYPNLTGWVFRSRPLTARPMVSNGLLFYRMDNSVHIYNGQNVFEIQLRELDLYFGITPSMLTLLMSVDRTKQRIHFRNEFRNRLKEYRGRHFVPLWKNLERIR